MNPNAIGAGLGMLGMLKQDQRTREADRQQRAMMGLQLSNQKELNQQGHDLQYDMWNKTNYGAQVKHLKDAGLSIGLMYGGGGAGGTTTGSQGGGSAAAGSSKQPMDIGNAVQAAMAASQIKVNEAQAKKLDAEANKTSGVDTDLAQGQLQKIIAETTNETLKGELIKIDTELGRIETQYRGEKLESEIMHLGEQIRSLKVGTDLTQAQFDSLVEEAQHRAAGAEINNWLMNSQISKNKKEVDKMKHEILQKWEGLRQSNVGLSQEERKININKFSEEIKANYPSLWNVGGNVVAKGVRTLEAIESWITGNKPNEIKID